MARTLYERSGNAPPPPCQRSREPTLQRPNKPKPEDRGRPRPLRGAGGGPCSTPRRPREPRRPSQGPTSGARSDPLPLSEFVDDPSPTPEDLAVEALSAEAALSRPAIPRAPSLPCLPASGWCSPPATASAAGGPRRCRTSPTGSASRAKGCASCSPARRRRWHDAAACREQAERRPVGFLAPPPDGHACTSPPLLPPPAFAVSCLSLASCLELLFTFRVFGPSLFPFILLFGCHIVLLRA
jgi:hypothetical protein